MLSKKTISNITNTLKVRLWGLLKVPMLWYIRPTILELDDVKCVVKVPLSRRNKNHHNSMYFGVLCAGADLAGGICAMNFIERSGLQISLIFQDFKADFLKRAEGDCYFINTQGREIEEFVKQVIESKERMSMPLYIEAKVPSKLGDEVVAKFTLGLSLKLVEN